MRVSILNSNLVGKDAIGASIIAQARFFLRRGDNVTIWSENPPEGVPADVAPFCRIARLAQLRQDRYRVFAASDIYIYHYGFRHSLMETITEISEHVSKIKTYVYEMIEARKNANRIGENESRAFEYCDKVKPYFDKIRDHVDKLELLVDDELWPLPKYRELLFIR